MSAIVIIGGGIVGSAAAYFTALRAGGENVSVLEPDPAYTRAATPAAAGGVRCLMSRPENIRMSAFGLGFYAGFRDAMSTSDHDADIAFRRNGYLFMVSADGVDTLQRNARTQHDEGANVVLLTPHEIRQRYPSLATRDVALGCYSPEDAWIDPQAALAGFRHKAKAMGVRYVKDACIDFDTTGDSVRACRLASGERIAGDAFVIAAGAWSSELTERLGVSLPVSPMCRAQHYFRVHGERERLPMVKTESGLFFRPEGEGYVGGCPSFDIAPGFVWDFDRGFFATYFEDVVWPLLADAVPDFERLRLERTWGGHYAQNRFDGNMIIGPFSRYRNIQVATGFSGHGIMHAPAVGRALSELVMDGGYQSLELARLGMQRVLDDSPYPELGIR